MIAKQILDMLEGSPIDGYVNGKMAMMAWGAEKFSGRQDVDDPNPAWLKFKVSGKLFSGFIQITETSDKFKVVLERLNHGTGQKQVVKTVTGIPGDKIGSVIDALIEGPQTP